MHDYFPDWRHRLTDAHLNFEERRFYEFVISTFLIDWDRKQAVGETRTPDRNGARDFLERHYSDAIVSDSDLDLWHAALRWLFSEYPGKTEAIEEVPDSAAKGGKIEKHDRRTYDAEDESDLPPMLRFAFDQAATRADLSDHARLAYWNWLRRFGRFCAETDRALDDPGGAKPFLEELGRVDRLTSQSRNQALIALKFVFRRVLEPGVELDVEPARKADREQVMLSRKELDKLFAVMEPELRLMCRLMYGAGLRSPELLGLRVRDLNFAEQLLEVRGAASGELERATPLPASVVEELREHLQRVRAVFDLNEREGGPGAPLPDAVGKRNPESAHAWEWQWVFPSRNLTRDRESGERRRQHWNAFTFQRGVKRAAALAGIKKRVTPHVFRHCFAIHLLQSGAKPKTVQQLMGHRTLETTMAYFKAFRQDESGPKSPLDF